jgi:hypothetical protein
MTGETILRPSREGYILFCFAAQLVVVLVLAPHEFRMIACEQCHHPSIDAFDRFHRINRSCHGVVADTMVAVETQL